VKPKILTSVKGKEEFMKRIACVVVVIMFALSLGCSVKNQPKAEQKNPVRFNVINTFKPGFADIKKAQLIQFEMDPGAEVKGFKLPCSEILWVTEGTFTYMYIYEHGEEMVERKKGQSWFASEGTLLDVYNKGNATAIIRGIQLYRTE
jgi:hypothetical protein